MNVYEKILENELKIFEVFSSLDSNYLKENMEFKTEEEWKLSSNFYTEKNSINVKPNFSILNIKNLKSQSFNKHFIQDKDLIKLFSHKKIYNIYLFAVWGDVLEHTDPDGRILGYPEKDYETLIMPIKIPSHDKKIFSTFFDKKYVDLREGNFVKVDVVNSPHYWKFDYQTCGREFILLHVDYSCQGGLDMMFDSVYNSNVALSRSIINLF